MRDSKSLSATLGRVLGIGVPMVVGGVITAAYLQLGVPRSPGVAIPKAVEVVAPSSSVPSTPGSGVTTTSEDRGSSDAGKLIVVSPTNPVLAYESGSSSPVEINPEANPEGGDKSSSGSEATTTTTSAATTTTTMATTTTAESTNSNQPSSDGGSGTTTTAKSSDSSGGDN
ncbi:MAG: hypothetical protein M0Z91_06615 [Actinomycetota bacterium]|nr:hypothetical protein [Actinomycetota bacterium]